MTGIVRWAVPADDPALRRLCRRTPMKGPLSYYLEREPDFFALTRRQGDEGGRVAVVAEDGDISAMAMIAPHRSWIDARPQLTAYLGDLKVDPDRRHEGLAGLLVRFLQHEIDRLEIERSYFLTLAGNPAFAQVGSASDGFRLRRIRSITNYIVPFAFNRARMQPGIEIRRASEVDLPEMAALWNDVHRRRTFAPVADATRFGAAEDFLVASKHGSIAGFCAPWDPSALKQIRLLRLSPALRLTASVLNILAAMRQRPAFPSAGECLRTLYVSRICAASADVLASLLGAVWERYHNDAYAYFDLALDRADPLTAAMQRFRSMKVEFDLWEAITAARAHTATLAPNDCAYFDMSFV
jgi:N-acetylglutamate synthase-like GNAT family acetyltransferase